MKKMKKTLKENIPEHYQRFELSPTQLDKLDQLQRNRKGRERSQLWFKFSFAAMAVSVLLLSLFLFRGTESIAEKIAEEIAYNHNKNMQLEIKTASIDDIQNFLSKIDFTLIQSKHLPSEHWELMGARYCSIQGKLAVLMKLKNQSDGKTQTLYQVTYPEDFKNNGPMPFETYVNGVQVKLWREKGLLLALAGS